MDSHQVYAPLADIQGFAPYAADWDIMSKRTDGKKQNILEAAKTALQIIKNLRYCMRRFFHDLRKG